MHDGYWLRLGISKADKLYEKRLTLLEKINVPAHGEFWIKTGSEPFEAQLIAFLRIFNMNEGLFYICLDLVSPKLDYLLYKSIFHFLSRNIRGETKKTPCWHVNSITFMLG